MIHHDWRHVMAEQERREREIARIQRRRQENALLPPASRSPRFYHRFFAYLGRRLVNLGWQLQSPYNRMALPPTLGPRPSDPKLNVNC